MRRRTSCLQTSVSTLKGFRQMPEMRLCLERLRKDQVSLRMSWQLLLALVMQGQAATVMVQAQLQVLHLLLEQMLTLLM